MITQEFADAWIAEHRAHGGTTGTLFNALTGKCCLLGTAYLAGGGSRQQLRLGLETDDLSDMCDTHTSPLPDHFFDKVQFNDVWRTNDRNIPDFKTLTFTYAGKLYGPGGLYDEKLGAKIWGPFIDKHCDYIESLVGDEK